MKKLSHLLFLFMFLFSMFSTTSPAYAAGMVVNSDADDSLVNLDANATCDLREAITNANADNQSGSTDCPAGSGADVITFDADYTITLVGSQLPVITTEITINGNGIDNTIIQANANPSIATYRLFEVSSTGNLTLDNLTVANGRCNGSCATDLTNGGALYNTGVVSITNSQFETNIASNAGGSIYTGAPGSSLTIDNSTFLGDTAFPSGAGGAIASEGSTVTIRNSTFSKNATNSAGGAIYSANSTVLTITNSTFSDNTASGNIGGAIYNGSTATITNSTFSGNNSFSINGATINNTNTLYLFNTIIANSGSGRDCHSTGSIPASNNNLMENNGTFTCGLTNGVNGNIIGSDPNLGSLTGSPAYFPLNTGSLAINAGDNTICAAAPVNNQSQNGVTRPEGTACDIGAYEHPDTTSPIVTSITRASTSATSASSVNFTVTFSENVTGVDVADFSLTTTGVSGASVTSVSGSNSTYTVSVNTGSGNGTIRLDVPNSATIADAFSNALSGLPFNTGEIYIVVKSPTFADVPDTYWAFPWIERLYAAGLTGGCTTSPLNYCPTLPVTRAEMAVFLERGLHGNSFTPPNVPATFGDTAGHWAEDWIEALKADGITGGCGGGNYCPNAPVTRAEMAVFLLRVMHSASYTPPNHAPTFGDSAGHWAEDWIEQLALEGITSGCGGGNYCPNSPATRDQMAVFLVKAFSLP